MKRFLPIIICASIAAVAAAIATTMQIRKEEEAKATNATTVVIANSNDVRLDTAVTTNSPADMGARIPECPGAPLVVLTEGPYYKTGSPEKTNLVEGDVAGEELMLNGYVLNNDCQPVANAWLDFWQADGNGKYDHSGFQLRGHQFTDANGKFTLQTVIPGEYPGRTNHIHVKVAKQQGAKAYTTQLFFSSASQNSTDDIYSKSMEVTKTSDQTATFNFRLPD